MNDAPLIAFIMKHAPEKQRELAERFSNLAAKALMLSIVETIPDDELLTLQGVLDTGNDAVLDAFLEKHIPDATAFVDAALADLRETTQDLLDATS